MGDRGPLPKPNPRRRNAREVKATLPASRPVMPVGLTGEARAEWDRVVPELDRMGVLASVDRGLLMRYCSAWADWVELSDQIEKAGRVVRGQGGELVRNPLWLLRRDAEATLIECGRQLTLTPAARLRAGIKHEQDEQAADDVAVTAIAEARARLRGSS